MDREEILRRKRAVEERYGPWLMHSFHLGQEVYTISPDWGSDERLRRMVQVVADVTDRPFAELRVLDLACAEGQFGLEFALQGAQVVMIEGREVHLEKVRFAAETLGLSNVQLIQDDVRNLNAAKHGQFDVVLCLGILYHLDVPDALYLVSGIAEACCRAAVFDTFAAPHDLESYEWGGNTYWGSHWDEHRSQATAEERIRATWDSLDNLRSFPFTYSSTCNLLRHVGFTSVYEICVPYYKPVRDRVNFLALKGRPQTIRVIPVTNEWSGDDWPERPEEHVYEQEDIIRPGQPAPE